MGWCIRSRASHRQLQQTACSEQHSPAQHPSHQSGSTQGKKRKQREGGRRVRQPQNKTEHRLVKIKA